MLRPKTARAIPLVLVTMLGTAQAEEVTVPQRDLVEAFLGANLVLPETALWRFAPIKPYLGDTRLICGQVNYQSSTRQFQGYHRFYALIEDTRITLAQIEDARQDPSGRLREKLDFLCGSS